jgi:hypothetical protein
MYLEMMYVCCCGLCLHIVNNFQAILLLCEVTRGNAHIQKLVAYENAFQVLLDIVRSEDESEFEILFVYFIFCIF